MTDEKRGWQLIETCPDKLDRFVLFCHEEYAQVWAGNNKDGSFRGSDGYVMLPHYWLDIPPIPSLVRGPNKKRGGFKRKLERVTEQLASSERDNTRLREQLAIKKGPHIDDQFSERVGDFT